MKRRFSAIQVGESSSNDIALFRGPRHTYKINWAKFVDTVITQNHYPQERGFVDMMCYPQQVKYLNTAYGIAGTTQNFLVDAKQRANVLLASNPNRPPLMPILAVLIG